MTIDEALERADNAALRGACDEAGQALIVLAYRVRVLEDRYRPRACPTDTTADDPQDDA